MKIFAPIYYKNFKCIADRCRHSCCIGWEIDIDEKTLMRYRKIEGVSGEKILRTVENTDGVFHFRLTDGERCPHLSPSGLCRIISEHGEEYLCDICREHPRFYNATSRGQEVGIGAVCEVAAELILNSPDYKSMIEIGSFDGDAPQKEFDTVAEREKIYAILSDSERAYEERLSTLWNMYGAAPDRLSDTEWHTVISSLEYLNTDRKGQFSCYSSSLLKGNGHNNALERFLAYLIYRHSGSAETKEEFRTSLGFAFFAERLLASLLRENSSPADLVRIISEELEYSEENTEAIKFQFI